MSVPFAELPFLAGILLSWSLAVIPGPGNALIAQDAAQRGLRAGILTGLGAIAGDLVMFVLMAQGLLLVLHRMPLLPIALGVVGAALMAYFAWGAWRAARRADALEVTGRGSFGRSFLTIVTSPFNWAWWITVGATLLAQMGWTLMLGFFLGLLAWVVFWSALARSGATRIRRFGEFVGYASAVTLALFAIVLAYVTIVEGIRLSG